MSPAAHGVIRRLDDARQKWWLFTLMTSAVLGASASLATLLLFMLGDAMVKFPQLVLLGMLLAWLAISIVLAAIVFRRMARSHRSLEATARRVEAEFPELGSNLINLVQLSSDTKNVDKAFREAAVGQAASRIGQVHFEDAAEKETWWQRFRCCMHVPRDLGMALAVFGALIVVAVLCYRYVDGFGTAGSRLMTPWTFVPSVGSVKIIKVVPGDVEDPTEVLVGSSLDVSVEIENPDAAPYEATLFITPEGAEETSLAMVPDEGTKTKYTHYRATVASVLGPMTYRLEVGDSQTRIYTVGVCKKPTVDEVEVTFHYPPYLHRSNETFMQKHADLEAPQYTEAELRIRPSVAIAKGHIEMEGKQYSGSVENDGQLLVVRKIPLVKDTSFTIRMYNKAEHTDPDARPNRIHVLPDRRPEVQLLKPERQSSAAPGSDVAVMIRAADDHGVGQVRLEVQVKKSQPAEGTQEGEKPASDQVGPVRIVQTWTELESRSTVVVHHRLELKPEQVSAGQTVLVRAVAADQRNIGKWGLDLQPQEAASTWHEIHLVDEQAKTAAALEQFDSLRAAIWKILEQQVRGRVRATSILAQAELAQRSSVAGEVRVIQVGVQKASIDLVKDIDKPDDKEKRQASQEEVRQAVKRVMNQLALGDMLQAVQQCDDLVKVKTLEGFAQPVPQLGATQDRIINTLRKLLDVVRHAQGEVLAEAKKRPGGDIPEDAKRKLEELRDKLDKYIEKQKKVIEATENLAKKPVEDFTEEDEKLLKALAASQDEFAKFMKDFHSDLSKLPEQDFANSTMAKELVEIQTEIKMAEDALLKKTADIAVPLEQLGYERAEEIKTNLEKWLPDTPDRERWSQEESLSDADKEAPMAELPGELEDLIGDLLEEEEDLFDEMEDVSSSAADSLDKGAGWDVSDGPISNMSAKGATGNRLPNTSEIGGRSGEGRSAKSNGEFVGDEAIGKGGRKTPSRLTPDPYMKGQVKDHSKDPTGGSTGGGKESGQGGEGLEGPTPSARDMRDMQRLAGKQAALRNKAEGADIQFQIMNFHHTDLKKMIELMAQIERDLKAGRYQSALRQRQVLAEGLGNVKQYLEGEFQIRKDATENLPSDIQKEILGSMQDPSPVGWEELNRQYFQRLSKGGAAPAAEPAPKKP